MGLFGRRAKKKSGQENDKTVSYDDALRTGSSIGKLITNIWNSQKNPGKAYLLNRRVHHGEIGILLGLSNLIKKSRPATAGVFSGLGEALAQDDIADKEEWFSFKKKEDKKTWKHLRQKRNETIMKKKITTGMEIRKLQSKISVLGICSKLSF
jgi:hypothetical protein